MKELKQDVIFIDAPWGGPLYYKKNHLDLYLGDHNLVDIVKIIYDNKYSKICILKVPNNFNFKTLNNLKNIVYHVYTLKKFIIIVILI